MNLEPFQIRSNHLFVSQVDVVELAKKYGTPFYVYDLAFIKRQYSLLRSCLPDNVDIYFAFKANPCAAVCAQFCALGAGAEVASEGELEIAKSVGFSPENIILNGPGKTSRLLHSAIEAGVGIVNIESQADFNRLDAIAGRLKKVVKVCVRINPSHQHSQARIKTGGGPQKFGTDEENSDRLIETIMHSANAELCGIHVYSGSQALNSSEVLAAIENTVNIADRLVKKHQFSPSRINIGGGLGVPYWGDNSDINIEAFGNGLSKLIDGYLRSGKFSETRFILELGRILVADAGLYVTEVLDVKSSHDKSFIITDGGINHAMLPITSNKYPVVLINRMDEASSFKSYIGGPLCTSADLSRYEICLPEADLGDLLGLLKSGAYGYSASLLNFLSFPSPAEIVVDNGAVLLARDHGSPKDFLRGQNF